MRNENRKTNEKKRKEERRKPTRKDRMSAKRREGMRERERIKEANGGMRKEEGEGGGERRCVRPSVKTVTRRNMEKLKLGPLSTNLCGLPVNQPLCTLSINFWVSCFLVHLSINF